MRAWLVTLLVALLGGLVIALVAPFVKILAVEHALRLAREDIDGDRPVPALQRLTRYAPWAMRYTSVAGPLDCETVRCHVRLGRTPEARRHADLMFRFDLTDDPPAWPRSWRNALAFAQEGPDWLANRTVCLLRGDDYTWVRVAGYSVLLTELEEAGQYRDLGDAARHVLQKDPRNRQARALIEYLDSTGSRTNVVRAEGRRPWHRHSAGPSPAPASSTGTVVATGPAAAGGADDSIRRKMELGERETELVARIEARRKALADTPPSVSPEYEAARTRYRDLYRRSVAMQEQFDKTTGQERINLMGELRRMKGEVARCEADLRRLEPAARSGSPSALPADPELEGLETELARVRDALRQP